MSDASYFRDYFKKNCARHKEAVLKWRVDHPYRAKAIDRHAAGKHRAKKFGAGLRDCCKSSEIVDLYEDAFRKGLQVDHVLALKLGGKHCKKNLQLLSHEQHVDKTTKDRAACRLLRKAA